MKKTLISIGSTVLSTFPILAFAQTSFQPSYATSLIRGLSTILKDLVIVLIALAVVWFIWNVVSYAMSDDEEKKGKAKDQMIHGIIAIAVCVSVWGLVALLQQAFLGGNGGNVSSQTQINNMIPSVTY